MPVDAVKVLQQRVRIRDIALLMYTSGTTATRKVAFSPTKLLSDKDTPLRDTRFLLTEDDAMWNPLPMFHCGGIVPLLGVISVGATFCHAGALRARQGAENDRR